jgi:hypothetical protein
MPQTDKIGILVIHGMGDQKPGYSDDCKREVNNRLGSISNRFVWQEVYWADALEPRESELWRRMKAARQPDGSEVPLEWQKIRDFVIHNFGDALAYHRDAQKDSAYAEIHEIVSTGIKTLKQALAQPENPIVVVAHSLGAHIMSNYIWDHQASNADASKLEPLESLAAMITFGCNIPLFSLSFSKATPIDVPGKGITKPAMVAASKWMNFVDRDDVLGWPLRPLYDMSSATFTAKERKTIDRIEDYEINVGGLLTSWNPAAHSDYWDDNDFTRPVANYLQKLLQALDA